VLRGDTLAGLATVPGNARSATVTTLSPGQPVTLVVEAHHGDDTVRSRPSNQVTPYTVPGSPTGLTITVTTSGSNSATINVDWNPGNDNGSPLTGHTIHITTSLGHDHTGQTGPTETSYAYPITCTNTPDTPCGGITIDVEIHATNDAGTGPDATTTRTYRPPPQITGMNCFVTSDRLLTCSVSFTGVATTINWSVNELDGRTSGTVPGFCLGGGGGTGSVRVTVSNEAGSDSRTDTYICPEGDIP
jgi:hypothetical protein